VTWTRRGDYWLEYQPPDGATGAARIATPTITVAYSRARQLVSYVLHAGSVVLASRACIDINDSDARRTAVAELQEQGATWHRAASATSRTGSC
jgi:hypothetical protein